MTLAIGAGGQCGVAFETTRGTYVAPTKFFPIRSESLSYKQDSNSRRPIRQLADVVGVVQGNSHVEGQIEIECTEDVLPYFLYASRNTIVKTGSSNFVYTTTPANGANTAPKPALSVTLQRNGEAFGYTGCLVTSMSFSMDSGMLICQIGLLGFNEATQSVPSPTWGTTAPFGAGMYTFSVGGAQVTDSDDFSLEINDSGTPVHRLNTSRAATSSFWGERSVSLKVTRDFESRTELDAFKAYTSTAVSLQASKGSNNQITFSLASTFKPGYEVSLSGQGDLLRAAVEYTGLYDASTSKSYEIVVKTQESITP